MPHVPVPAGPSPCARDDQDVVLVDHPQRVLAALVSLLIRINSGNTISPMSVEPNAYWPRPGTAMPMRSLSLSGALHQVTPASCRGV